MMKGGCIGAMNGLTKLDGGMYTAVTYCAHTEPSHPLNELNIFKLINFDNTYLGIIRMMSQSANFECHSYHNNRYCFGCT
jgi:hypothetical protein